VIKKNAVIAYGSPRLRKSGSYHLGQHFSQGLKKGGFNIDEIMIHEKTIKPCLGCFSCWSTSPGKCVHRDDMDNLLPILYQADLIVYAVPLYVYSVPGSVKTFMDRQIPLAEGYMNETEGLTAHPRRNKEKALKAFILSVAGFPEKVHFDPMIAMFKQFFRPTRERYLGEIIIAGANSMAYDRNQQRYAQLYTLIEQAGYEIAQNGHVNDSTLNRIDEITRYTPEKIKAFHLATNQYWDSFLRKDSTI
jgi:multimeric flavodoxin WrbA